MSHTTPTVAAMNCTLADPHTMPSGFHFEMPFPYFPYPPHACKEPWQGLLQGW